MVLGPELVLGRVPEGILGRESLMKLDLYVPVKAMALHRKCQTCPGIQFHNKTDRHIC